MRPIATVDITTQQTVQVPCIVRWFPATARLSYWNLDGLMRLPLAQI